MCVTVGYNYRKELQFNCYESFHQFIVPGGKYDIKVVMSCLLVSNFFLGFFCSFSAIQYETPCCIHFTLINLIQSLLMFASYSNIISDIFVEYNPLTMCIIIRIRLHIHP